MKLPQSARSADSPLYQEGAFGRTESSAPTKCGGAQARRSARSASGVLVGAMLIAFGIVKLIGYFSRDLYRLAFQFDLALGIFLVVLGAIILLNPTRAMTFLCLMLGIAIMADGLFKLQTALDARRFGLHSWGLILAFALLTGAIGGLLAARPAESVGTLTILLGLSVLFEGLMNLCVALFAVKVIRKEQPEVVETWFESKKEER